MGFTPNFNFPYPELTDTPDGATQVKALADAVDAEIEHVLSGGTVSSPVLIVTDTWHTITLDSGWSVTSGFDAPQYRLLPTGDLQLRGAAQRTSFTTDVDLNSAHPLPSAYRPANTHHFRAYDNSTGTPRAGAQIASSGVITAKAVGTTSSQIIEIDAIIALG